MRTPDQEAGAGVVLGKGVLSLASTRQTDLVAQPAASPQEPRNMPIVTVECQRKHHSSDHICHHSS